MVSIYWKSASPGESTAVTETYREDDTSIFYSHSDLSRLQSVLKEELQNFDVWLKCNKLSVNIKKTNYIIFKSRQKKLDYNFSLSFGNQSLKQNNVVKFLGVYLDEHLETPH